MGADRLIDFSETDPVDEIKWVDLKPMVTHRYKLDDIGEAYDLFANQEDGVMKGAVTP